jgi:hypothetical protein
MRKAANHSQSNNALISWRGVRVVKGHESPHRIAHSEQSLQFHLPQQRAKSWMPMQAR